MVRVCAKAALVAAVSSPLAFVSHRLGDGDIAPTAHLSAFSSRHIRSALLRWSRCENQKVGTREGWKA
jgi:hypothetical protein